MRSRLFSSPALPRVIKDNIFRRSTQLSTEGCKGNLEYALNVYGARMTPLGAKNQPPWEVLAGAGLL